MTLRGPARVAENANSFPIVSGLTRATEPTVGGMPKIPKGYLLVEVYWASVGER